MGLKRIQDENPSGLLAGHGRQQPGGPRNRETDRPGDQQDRQRGLFPGLRRDVRLQIREWNWDKVRENPLNVEPNLKGVKDITLYIEHHQSKGYLGIKIQQLCFYSPTFAA